MSISIQGVIERVLPAKSGISSSSGKQWHKQDYVLVHTDGPYTRRFCFSVFGAERIARLNLYEGLSCTVYLNFDSREHNGNWYNSFDCYMATPIQQQPATPQQPAPQAPFPQQPAPQQPAAPQQPTAAPEPQLPF